MTKSKLDYFLTKKEALQAGKQALKRLVQSDGWNIEVWRNSIGWYMGLTKGCVTLNYNRIKRTFSSSFNVPHKRCGETFWTTNFEHSDPNKVLAKQVEKSYSFIKECISAISRVV